MSNKINFTTLDDFATATDQICNTVEMLIESLTENANALGKMCPMAEGTFDTHISVLNLVSRELHNLVDEMDFCVQECLKEGKEEEV